MWHVFKPVQQFDISLTIFSGKQYQPSVQYPYVGDDIPENRVVWSFLQEELMSMMHEAGTETIHHHQINEGNNMQSVIAQRFAELDRDKDGEFCEL